MAGFTEEHVEQWRTEGWVLIPELVPAEAIDAALDDMWRVLPTPEEFHAGEGGSRQDAFLGGTDQRRLFSEHDRPDEDGPAFRNEQFLGQAMFPFPGSNRLNRLIVHPNMVGFAEAAIASTDLLIYQMSIWAKYTGVANYEQPHHQDHNHSVVPPRTEPDYWFMEGFLYLSDVDEDVAPTHAVRVSDSGGGMEVGVRTPEQAPELYAAERSAAGPRGSYLAYRPDVWHRGVNLEREGGARFLYGISFKQANQDWVGYTNVQPRATTPRFVRFVESCTPRELALFGVPLPGHAYWDEPTIDATAARHPGPDIEPWRAGLGSGPTGSGSPGCR